MQKTISNQVKKEKYPYGMRLDGTPKGKGWLGEIPHVSGGIMTEFSVGVDFDGKETLIPTIVPTLAPDEIKVLQSLPKGQPILKNIVDKAV